MALSPPFETSASKAIAVPLPGLSDLLKPLHGDRRFGRMGVVLVDLSYRTRLNGTSVGLSFMGGWNSKVTQFAASLVKIAAMFAAFRLRKNIRKAAAGATAKNPKDLLNEITADWKPIVQQTVSGPFKDFPNLDKIFRVTGRTGAWSIEFERSFLNNMELMIGPSKNGAASYCILALGYQYIVGALTTEGFYSEADGGGIWLSGDYSAGKDWKKEKHSGKNQAANAAAVAAFMSQLEANKLVDESSSTEMRAMMWDCYALRTLKANSRPADAFGKIGIGPDNTSYHDCAVVQRSVGGKTIRYASVVLGVTDFSALVSLLIELDNVILTLHGLSKS